MCCASTGNTITSAMPSEVLQDCFSNAVTLSGERFLTDTTVDVVGDAGATARRTSDTSVTVYTTSQLTPDTVLVADVTSGSFTTEVLVPLATRALHDRRVVRWFSHVSALRLDTGASCVSWGLLC